MHIHNVVAPQAENIHCAAQITTAGIKRLGQPMIGLINDFPEAAVNKRRDCDFEASFTKLAKILLVLQALAWSAVFGVRT